MNRDWVKFGLLALSFQIAPLFNNEFPYIPPKNFTLNPAYIALHHPVTTNSPAAQLYFDQGLTFMYAFNHDAAYWSFLKGTEEDPNCAMNFWGMAMALGPNINTDITPKRAEVALDVINMAIKLFPLISESEKDYITALSTRYSTDRDANLLKLAENFSNSMGALSKKYPDDPDAAVLYASSLMDINPWGQWDSEGNPLRGTKEIVTTLENILKANPNHLGANHFYIHAVEASKYPERALVCASRLKELLPSSGHILHMPSHIFLNVGDYHKSALANENAIAADRDYIRKYGEGGRYPLDYLSHSLYFLTHSYTLLGNYFDAKRTAEELTELYLPHYKDMPKMEFYAAAPVLVMLQFNKWEEILEIKQPDKEMRIANALWTFCRAAAFTGLKKLKSAIEERENFLESVSTLPKDALIGATKADKAFKIAEYYLDGKLSELQGDPTKAIDSLREALAIQSTLGYNELPNWFFPVEITLGGMLLRQGKFQEAETIFRQNLAKHPRSGRALFGLKESSAGQSKTQDLYWINQEYEQAWRYSDIQLNMKEL